MHGPLSAAKAQGSVTARSVLLFSQCKCPVNTGLGIQDAIFEEFAMTEAAYDLLIRGGRGVTVSDGFEADVAISGETIAAIGRGLSGARREIDARGKLVLPGGVDSHAHIEQ